MQLNLNASSSEMTLAGEGGALKLVDSEDSPYERGVPATAYSEGNGMPYFLRAMPT